MTIPTEPINRDEESPRVVRTTIEIVAPPERVFEALTDVRELARWWGGDDARVLDCEADPRPGGAWRVRTVDRDGREQTFGGDYRIIDPPRRLEQTWHTTDDPEPSIVRYDLEPLEVDGSSGTRLTVTHTETFALSGITAFAAHVMQARLMLPVRHRFQPAWFAAPHRAAWAGRVIAR